jgi:hypothetical protein
LVPLTAVAVMLALTAVGAQTSAQTSAQTWPPGPIASVIGIQAKPERTTDEDLATIRSTGFGYVRFDMRWADVESRPGIYDWRYFDAFITRLRDHDLKAVVILNSGNAAYSGMVAMRPDQAFGQNALAAAPSSERDIRAFADFAAAAVDHFGGSDIVWEIWNEPDTIPFWPPRPNPAAYAQLAGQACTAMRRVDPKARIIAPALAGIPGQSRPATELLEKLLRSPAADCLSALSFHLHRLKQVPETVLDDYAQRIRPFVAANARSGQPSTIISGEWGYTTTKVTPEQQGAYLIRSLLINIASGVPLSIWYEWRDSGTDAADDEAQFGLLDSTGRSKNPAALAMLQRVKDWTVDKRLPVDSERCWVLRLREPDGTPQLMVWLSDTHLFGDPMLTIGGAQHKLSAFPQLFAEKGPASCR